MEKRATYTTIVHKTLSESGLSAIEFIVADVIDKLSNPWCTMSRAKLEAMLGVSERNFKRIVATLVERAFIETDRNKGMRSTNEWKDLVNTEYEAKMARTNTDSGQDGPILGPNRPQVRAKMAPLYSYNDNNNYSSEPVQEKENALPSYFGKTPYQRIVAVYSMLWYSNYKTKYKANFAVVTKLYKPLLEQYSEMQIAALLIIHFSWHGANGDDEFIASRLEKEMYPITWVPSKVNEYSTYITNVAKVNFEAMEGIREYVKKELSAPLKEAIAAEIIKLPEKP